MAAPSVRAFTTNRVATTSLSLNKPTGTASGDLLVAILFPVGPPTTEKTVTPGDGGFSEVTAAHSPIDDGSWRGDLRIYVKPATGSEGSSYSFTASSADHFAGILVAIQGADTAAAIAGVVNVIEDQASLILSGLSTSEDDSLILVAQIGWDAAGDAATPTATGLTFTEHFDDAGNDIAFATAPKATAGAVGNITITALDFRFCAFAVAIAPPTGGTETLNFTATITPAGALAKQTRKPFAATITPAGALARAKSLVRAYAATITPSGALSKLISHFFTATIAPAGLLASTKLIVKAFTATITPTGALTSIKAVIKFFTGAITPAGALTRAASFVKNFTGTITPAGSFARVASLVRNYTAIITPSGLLTNAASILRSYTAIITPAGSFAGLKVIVRAFTATITPAGAFTKISIKSFVGLIAPAGTLGRTATLFRTYTATITPQGALFKTVFKFFSGVIGLVGAFIGGITGIADQVNVKVNDRARTQGAVSDRVKTTVTISDDLGN